METVYDHNPTKEEISHIGLDSPGYKEIEGALTKNSHFAFIASLFHSRGDKQKMDEYINKISDPDSRFMVWYSHHHFSSESDII